MVIGALWYGALLATASYGNRYIEGYVISRVGDRTTLSGPYLTGTLTDNNNDGIVDKKIRAYGGGFHGTLHREEPVTIRDQRIFSDITSKLK